MNKENVESRISFTQQGEKGMEIAIVGSGDILMSMLHSAIMSHTEVRKIIIPVVMSLLKSDEFMRLTLDDMVAGLTPDDDEHNLDTN